MRHGESESNVRNIVSSNLGTNSVYGLTDKGRAEAEKAGKELEKESIDIIITSPFARTMQTAEIVAENIGFDKEKIIIDARLGEINTGIFDGKSIHDYRNYFSSMQDKFEKRPEGGENILDVKRRVMAFLVELEKEYAGKTILVVSHEYPVWMLSAGVLGAGVSSATEIMAEREDFLKTGGVFEISYIPFPHNADFEFDVHRPYIDELSVFCDCGGSMKRVEYVFDCWFESGSMPYAQFHYPFENKELFEKNFPADFIAEGIDQTRGWFYSLIVLATGLFEKAPFQNVIVSGMVQAEDGQKMSKHLKNYPDPWDVLNKYGADAVRYYLLASPIVHAEDIAFSEKGVDEVVKKVIMRLMNVLSFYELYRGDIIQSPILGSEIKNPLDQWILARLAELEQGMTASLDAYELDRAVKPIGLFVDDLSTWYLRRSRDRFKSDDVADRAHAIETTRTVLLEFSKLLAPVMPFLAEHIYSKMNGQKESVHLESWPKFKEPHQAILADMAEVRRVVSLALEARAKAGIKVRQPLQELKVKSGKLKMEYIGLIKDEVNVKEVTFDNVIVDEVYLDTTITPELKREGQFRELVRTVQELRKTKGFMSSDTVMLTISTNDLGRALVKDFEKEFKKTSLIREISFGEVSVEPVDIDGISFALMLSL